MPTEYYWTTKKRLQKEARKSIKIFLKKKKTRNEYMVVSNIRVFLKKEKERSVSMNVNPAKIFLNIKNKE